MRYFVTLLFTSTWTPRSVAFVRNKLMELSPGHLKHVVNYFLVFFTIACAISNFDETLPTSYLRYLLGITDTSWLFTGHCVCAGTMDYKTMEHWMSV